MLGSCLADDDHLSDAPMQNGPPLTAGFLHLAARFSSSVVSLASENDARGGNNCGYMRLGRQSPFSLPPSMYPYGSENPGGVGAEPPRCVITWGTIRRQFCRGAKMNLFTIGYGGPERQAFSDRLKKAGLHTVVDARLRPDRGEHWPPTSKRRPLTKE